MLGFKITEYSNLLDCSLESARVHSFKCLKQVRLGYRFAFALHFTPHTLD
jgi:hypothetical protein